MQLTEVGIAIAPVALFLISFVLFIGLCGGGRCRTPINKRDTKATSKGERLHQIVLEKFSVRFSKSQGERYPANSGVENFSRMMQASLAVYGKCVRSVGLPRVGSAEYTDRIPKSMKRISNKIRDEPAQSSYIFTEALKGCTMWRFSFILPSSA